MRVRAALARQPSYSRLARRLRAQGQPGNLQSETCSQICQKKLKIQKFSKRFGFSSRVLAQCVRPIITPKFTT